MQISMFQGSVPVLIRSLRGLPYLFQHLMPNVHFHVMSACNVPRHNGVELRKQDFLGPATP
jgi:hypothetical protein